ncbi:MAG TPA: glycosyltransferase, partial [Gemmatirosa sp.]
RAVRSLRDDAGRDDFHCVLVGGGPHQEAMRDYAAEQGVASLCTFTGRVSDEVLCRVLSSADVAVDPDPWTPWSDKSTMNKIMEYMFFGLPIVAFDLRENRVSAADAAVYAPADDERELARLIDTLLDDDAARRAMACYGERRVREALAWEYSAPNLLAAYERAFVA